MIVEKILQSKKNSNCILDLEKSLLSDDEGGILSSMDTFQELFTQLYTRKMIQLSSDLDTNEEKYRLWLIERKNDLVANLLTYLNYENEKIQEKSLEVLMTLVRLEGAHKETWNFPVKLFDKIVNELLNSNINQEMNVLKFQEYMQYDDILLHSLKAVMDILNKMEEVTDIFLTNLFYLLNTIRYPKEEFQTVGCNAFLSQNNPKTAPFLLKRRQLRRLFSDVWGRYLKFPLPLPLLKKVLLVLHRKVIPHLENPCLMTDFLTDSYSQKGVISLLSLNSLFLLMDKYNIEYPDFFVKLYSLTNAEVINGKFNLRFFYLTDLFLSSIHIPAYLIAAFVKKLSRIALISRTDCVLRILCLVINLMIRHKSVSVLFDREDPTTAIEDPFDFDEPDPLKCRAMESSLWEIKTLQSHVVPSVCRKAKMINRPLQSFELENVALNATMDSVSMQ
ncbi:nucleolar complex protein 4 homolog B [Trichonephila inaurata madagascariensis]|uniref:Nucleolar complex protein 4 homolog B n=1 Tax=Trichonephila inaurata madagascariensis TaxID=2747483 RepID=A0A8X7CS07_9ARAC|nr:nucleolar complex protein 4 homolog B [Trichonephila inaurata madagascariensis]